MDVYGGNGRCKLLGAIRSANGNRTRISALRGRRPEPLDDSAKGGKDCTLFFVLGGLIYALRFKHTKY